jgi:hypothetical protein
MHVSEDDEHASRDVGICSGPVFQHIVRIGTRLGNRLFGEIYMEYMDVENRYGDENVYTLACFCCARRFPYVSELLDTP